MTRAAETLNVAQTALGFQIRNLEEELGVRLIERHSRGVRLTGAGELFYDRLQDVFVALESAVAEVRRLDPAQSAPIFVGVTPAIMAMLGPGILGMAAEAASARPIKFVEALSFNLISALLRDEMQFALAFNVPDRPGFERTALLEETLFLVTSAEQGNNGVPVPFHEVVRSDLALVSRQDIIWGLVTEAAQYLSLPVKAAFEVQSTSAIKTLIERGVANSVMPFGIVAEEVHKGLLCARPIANARIVRTLFMVHPRIASCGPDEAAVQGVIFDLARCYAEALGPFRRLLHDAIRPTAAEAPQTQWTALGAWAGEGGLP